MLLHHLYPPCPSTVLVLPCHTRYSTRVELFLTFQQYFSCHTCRERPFFVSVTLTLDEWTASLRLIYPDYCRSGCSPVAKWVLTRPASGRKSPAAMRRIRPGISTKSRRRPGSGLFVRRTGSHSGKANKYNTHKRNQLA